MNEGPCWLVGWVEKGCNTCGAAGLLGFFWDLAAVWLCFGLLLIFVRFIPLSDFSVSLCIIGVEDKLLRSRPSADSFHSDCSRFGLSVEGHAPSYGCGMARGMLAQDTAYDTSVPFLPLWLCQSQRALLLLPRDVAVPSPPGPRQSLVAHQDEVLSQQDLAHFGGSIIAKGLEKFMIGHRENILFP